MVNIRIVMYGLGVTALKRIAKERGMACYTRYNRATKDELASRITTLDETGADPGPSDTRRKASAGRNESNDIKRIIDHINNQTELGRSMVACLKQVAGVCAVSAHERAVANRRSHYDFAVTDEDGKEHRVEHKGSSVYRKISRSDRPWETGVQFANLGCDKVRVGREYALLWYDEYIASGVLSEDYNISAEVPSFEEWFKRDCCSQGNPRSAFGIELKKNYRAKTGSGSLLSLRKTVNDVFLERVDQLTDQLSTEIERTANEYLSQKDLWLQVAGPLDGEFSFFWSKRTLPLRVERITCTAKSDIDFAVTCSEGPNITAKLRWGKGAGFSNLRLDLR